jgi:GNAT superfamily N-acetyltransferase
VIAGQDIGIADIFPPTIHLRAGVPADAARCAAIFDAWVDTTEWMPRLHPPGSVARFHREHLFKTCRVFVAEAHGRGIAGYLALDGEGFVAALYLAEWARGRGVGARLIAEAKATRPEGLTLHVFAANEGARRFYAREGFVETGGTDGENDEGLPDLFLEWRAFR